VAPAGLQAGRQLGQDARVLVLRRLARQGWVEVRRISDARISWPQTIVGRNRALIVCGDLVKAIQIESNQAVAYWWGGTPQTVSSWRKALGVDRANEGSREPFLYSSDVVEKQQPGPRF
jgi:hypothetical protein